MEREGRRIGKLINAHGRFGKRKGERKAVKARIIRSASFGRKPKRGIKAWQWVRMILIRCPDLHTLRALKNAQGHNLRTQTQKVKELQVELDAIKGKPEKKKISDTIAGEILKSTEAEFIAGIEFYLARYLISEKEKKSAPEFFQLACEYIQDYNSMDPIELEE